MKYLVFWKGTTQEKGSVLYKRHSKSYLLSIWIDASAEKKKKKAQKTIPENSSTDPDQNKDNKIATTKWP